MMSDNKSVSGFHLGRIRDKQLLQDAMTALFKLYTEGAIKPRIDEVFAFEDVSLLWASTLDTVQAYL